MPKEKKAQEVKKESLKSARIRELEDTIEVIKREFPNLHEAQNIVEKIIRIDL